MIRMNWVERAVLNTWLYFTTNKTGIFSKPVVGAKYIQDKDETKDIFGKGKGATYYAKITRVSSCGHYVMYDIFTNKECNEALYNDEMSFCLFNDLYTTFKDLG